ncbi:hypothetical protein RIF29_27621 [Crotalaria pallida]|uniref:Uncharacterized protein n=1 Tax=Crotalaria pallida TaxID=3830 RepID=A0AAN9EPX7_CROPI
MGGVVAPTTLRVTSQNPTSLGGKRTYGNDEEDLHVIKTSPPTSTEFSNPKPSLARSGSSLLRLSLLLLTPNPRSTFFFVSHFRSKVLISHLLFFSLYFSHLIPFF